MEGGSAATTNGNEGSAKKGLDGTGLDLPLNRHGNLKSASSDQSLKDILLQIKSSKTPAVVNYGASWCGVCSQILPSFCQLSNNFPKLSFIYADIDECPETTQHIRYTPTFHFYRDGEKSHHRQCRWLQKQYLKNESKKRRKKMNKRQLTDEAKAVGSYVC
nr:thioredoxin-like 3-3 [Quercus suber]